jgi:RimJ/RimL family protein N-acetyltransferase
MGRDRIARMQIRPTTLIGRLVRLEPLTEEHIPALTRAGRDASIWRYMRYGIIHTQAQMRAWVLERLTEQDRGTDLPFVVTLNENDRLIGATRYMEIRPMHRGLEIGGTWYEISYQGTAVNSECKYLLLQQAFEALGCIRVQLKTDSRNQRSQRAIEGIGAVKEGLLRNHMILPDGTIRHSVYYSIIDSEWPRLKARLQNRIEKKLANT